MKAGCRMASELAALEPIAPLALRPRDAAKALGIGQRKLWGLTSPRGPIACIRLSSGLVLYPIEALRQWLAEETQRASSSTVPTPHP